MIITRPLVLSFYLPVLGDSFVQGFLICGLRDAKAAELRFYNGAKTLVGIMRNAIGNVHTF
jgi:hypothetical protein